MGEGERRFSGTGLGLMISRQFINLLGGEINVENCTLGGCKFSFTINMPETRNSKHVSKDEIIGNYIGPRRNITIISDSAGEQRALIRFLIASGFNVQHLKYNELLKQKKIMGTDIFLVFSTTSHKLNKIMSRLRHGNSKIRFLLIGIGVKENFRRTCMQNLIEWQKNSHDVNSLMRKFKRCIKFTGWRTNKCSVLTEYRTATCNTPPAAEMQRLHRLVQIGNMRSIIEFSKNLASTEKKYSLFANQLLHLAEGYQSMALLRLVEDKLELRTECGKEKNG